MVYLVETYRSRGSAQSDGLIHRVQEAAGSRSVQLVGRLVVPSDEIEFWLFDAASRADLATALTAAGIRESRISAVEDLTLIARIQ